MTEIPPRGRFHIRWRWVIAAALALAVAGGWLAWNDMRATHSASVAGAVDKYRSRSPAPVDSADSALPVPAPGVYSYTTNGSERISAGVVHHYPRTTTLTVTPSGCGVDLRWDALAERWMSFRLCRSAEGWRLPSYIDLHKFLYMKDERDYTCAADDLAWPVDRSSGTWTVNCTTPTGTIRSDVTVLGSEQRTVAGTVVPTTHIRVRQAATGPSTTDGDIEAWVADATGLPVRVVVRNHGSQKVLGSQITYDEAVTFDLASLTPAR